MAAAARIPFAIAAALLAGACAAPREAKPPEDAQANRKFEEAATAPLHDLNLVRAPIPAVLVAAGKAPYALPADASCAGLAAEVESLDAVLGADLDTPVTDKNPSLIERSSDAAGRALVSALRSTTESVIPFRTWVRHLTGAERYSREVAAAIAAGSVRRSYLKGLGEAWGCEAPAAPRR
jgi:hypothetical protein